MNAYLHVFLQLLWLDGNPLKCRNPGKIDTIHEVIYENYKFWNSKCVTNVIYNNITSIYEIYKINQYFKFFTIQNTNRLIWKYIINIIVAVLMYHVKCTVSNVPCQMYHVKGTMSNVPCSMFFVPCQMTTDFKLIIVAYVWHVVWSFELNTKRTTNSTITIITHFNEYQY